VAARRFSRVYRAAIVAACRKIRICIRRSRDPVNKSARGSSAMEDAIKEDGAVARHARGKSDWNLSPASSPRRDIGTPDTV